MGSLAGEWRAEGLAEILHLPGESKFEKLAPGDLKDLKSLQGLFSEIGPDRNGE